MSKKSPRDSYAAYGKYQIEKSLIKDFKNQAVLAIEEAFRQLPPGFAKTYVPASP